MNGKQLALLVHAALLIGVLLWLVPALTQWDSRAGYLFSLTFYWLFFCLPVIGLHALPGNDGRLFSEKLPWRDWWLIPLLLAQIGLIAIVAFAPNTAILTNGGMWLAILIATINGPLEEMAWRGGFLATFRAWPRLGLWLGWALFSLWHVPLALSHGVVFDGGAAALIGGAALLGLLWSWIAWRTGSVFYVSIAHTLTNLFTFWVLFDRNGFAA
ncbi:CPBP family intramembrane metalloprotease [Devosia sp. YIM 151766]|uniref:CPBP family intramembrane glutamic endopeptidase n=1 Tax=Devosia sp. YIM 151766 TaxID=3017325 RepID=UPI00255CAE02|nr:CPBP family intramembrane glutamic endopeptidase [Devosia sp. YIM 151766]WIY52751.1 CPBP family intramembrane metalloprotease [Devosia sp. YIM 151766]